MQHRRCKVALDVHYDEAGDTARAAAVVFVDWGDAAPALTRVRLHRGLAPYVSGQFYRRELPCLLPLIAVLRAEVALETIVVDGQVDLGPDRPGLGRHLLHALERAGGDGPPPEIIGVAKTAFVGAPALAVRRGRSDRPLWVSSTGSAREAAENVRAMHGPDRLPTLLRGVDHLARGLWHPEGDSA